MSYCPQRNNPYAECICDSYFDEPQEQLDNVLAPQYDREVAEGRIRTMYEPETGMLLTAVFTDGEEETFAGVKVDSNRMVDGVLEFETTDFRNPRTYSVYNVRYYFTVSE